MLALGYKVSGKHIATGDLGLILLVLVQYCDRLDQI